MSVLSHPEGKPTPEILEHAGAVVVHNDAATKPTPVIVKPWNNSIRKPNAGIPKDKDKDKEQDHP